MLNIRRFNWNNDYIITKDDGGLVEPSVSLVVDAHTMKWDGDCPPEPVPQTVYRWHNLKPSEGYYCSGTTKMYKQIKQVSNDYGATWTDVEPAEYQMGGVYQTESIDCGFIPPIIYRWNNLDPATEYYCSGTTKMYKQIKQVSTDSGKTWTDVEPAEYQMGGVAEKECMDCGFIPEPQYRWVDGDDSCYDTIMLVNQKKQVSYDRGKTWQDVEPLETKKKTVKDWHSFVCGWPSETAGRIVFDDGWDENSYSKDIEPTDTIKSYRDISDGYRINVFEFELSGDTLESLCGVNTCSIDGGGTQIREINSIVTPLSTRHIAANCFNGNARNGGNKIILLNEGLLTIGRNGFYGLATRVGKIYPKIVIPSTVTKIEKDAFGWSTNTDGDGRYMITYYFMGQTPPEMGRIWNIYEPEYHIKLVVPTGTKEAYRNALDSVYSGVTIEEIDTNHNAYGLISLASELSHQGLSQDRSSIAWEATYTSGRTWSRVCDAYYRYVNNTTFKQVYPYHQPKPSDMLTVKINECFDYVGSFSFKNCTNLTDVILPSTIEEIFNTFNDLGNLTSVTIYATTPPKLSYSFENTPNVVIYVLADCLEAYRQADGWKNLTIEAIP